MLKPRWPPFQPLKSAKHNRFYSQRTNFQPMSYKSRSQKQHFSLKFGHKMPLERNKLCFFSKKQMFHVKQSKNTSTSLSTLNSIFVSRETKKQYNEKIIKAKIKQITWKHIKKRTQNNNQKQKNHLNIRKTFKKTKKVPLKYPQTQI